MENKLPPIPTPASQRWREFRIQVLPFIMFAAIVAAIVCLWRAYVQPIGVIGFAETNQVSVTSLSDGVIENLYVESFQVVTQGQIIAMVSGTSAELIRAQTASAQAELELMRDRLKIDISRVAQNIFDARENLHKYELAQAGAMQDWPFRSNDFRRAETQLKDKTIPEAEFDRIKSTFDVLSTQINERQKMISDLKLTLESMQKQNTQSQVQSVDRAVEAKNAELELMLKPSYLRAPIDGMVSMVHRRQGERILRGDSVATISDPQARRVIGYIRQPLNLIPSTNDTVKILKRTAPTAIGQGRIQRVGAQFEIINPALLASDSKRLEVGLPILVSVPQGFPLVPGEYVTLTIDYVR